MGCSVGGEEPSTSVVFLPSLTSWSCLCHGRGLLLKAHPLQDKPLLNTQAHPARFELLTELRSLE